MRQLPDGKTQAYSSLLFEGPKLVAAFNGLYKVAFDYAESPTTRAFIEAHIAQERQVGATPHILPFKREGVFFGDLQVCDSEQRPVGTTSVQIRYRPLTLLRAEVEVTMTGAIEKRFRYERSRSGNRHFFEGPDVFGNAIGYGRALFTSQHFYGEALKIKGREFLLDDKHTTSVVWHFHQSDKPRHMVFGVLKLEAGAEVLKPVHDGVDGARP